MAVAVLGAGPHGREIARWLGDTQLFDDNLDGYPPISAVPADMPYVVGAAWPWVREHIATRARRLTPHNRGVVVFRGAQLGDGVELGDHVHVGFNAVVCHGCQVGPFTTICPGAVLSGEVLVGHGVVIGAGATIVHGGIKIGDGAFIGAGAVVLDDVEPDSTMVGVPARPV